MFGNVSVSALLPGSYHVWIRLSSGRQYSNRLMGLVRIWRVPADVSPQQLQASISAHAWHQIRLPNDTNGYQLLSIANR